MGQRLICGRISSNGKNLRKPAAFLAGNFFIKKAPASSRRGPTRKETYTPPPKSSVPSPVECKSVVFYPSCILPANCRQAELLNWASGLNLQAAFNLFMFSPTSIKVYYTNRPVQIEGAAFYRRPIKLILDTGCSILDAGYW